MLIHLQATTQPEAINEARTMITGRVMEERTNGQAHYFMMEKRVYFAVEKHASGFVVVGEQSAKNYAIIRNISKIIR